MNLPITFRALGAASLSAGFLCASPMLHAQDLTGVWTGTFSLHMRVAESGIVLGNSTGNYWIWNFDEGWAQFGETDPGVCNAPNPGDDVSECGQGMLSVGFPFHVQDIGNVSSEHDRAYFTVNDDGNYVLKHGYQIYNPYVGNPRTEMETIFRITRDGDQLTLATTDPDGDGVPGWPVPNVFPLTVSPGFDGVLTSAGGGAPIPDPEPDDPAPAGDLIGLFIAASTSIQQGESTTLTWQAVRATSCTASGAWSGSKPNAGTEDVQPGSAGTHTYKLSCTDGSTSMERIATVEVQAAPVEPVRIANFAVSSTSITLGQSISFTWQAENASSCSVSSGNTILVANLPAAGSRSYTPSAEGLNQFKLTCVGEGETEPASRSIDVQVIKPAPEPEPSPEPEPTPEPGPGSASDVTAVPVNSPLGLGLLAGVLALMAGRRTRRRG